MTSNEESARLNIPEGFMRGAIQVCREGKWQTLEIVHPQADHMEKQLGESRIKLLLMDYTTQHSLNKNDLLGIFSKFEEYLNQTRHLEVDNPWFSGRMANEFMATLNLEDRK